MSDHDDDERLLAELGAAVRAAAEVPPRFVAAGKAAFAWRNIDAELAMLSQDSAALAGTRAGDAGIRGADGGTHAGNTRAEPAALRALTFVASRLTVEVELAADALHGQLVPPSAGEVEVHGPDGPAGTVPVDDVGWFTVRPVPARMVRLLIRTADGQSVLTQWMTP